MYHMSTRPFFIHPYANARGNHGVANGEQGQHHSPAAGATAANGSGVPTRQPRPAPARRGMMTEMKVSLATNQLSEQVKESTRFWRGFQNEYWKEVNVIKFYVGMDVLQQIWRKKVEFKDGQQFAIQSMKLESCLKQFDEAAQLCTSAWSSDNSSNYDSRQHHSEKVRATGNLVVSLSRTSETTEAACKDLLKELAELEKLIDAKSPTASVLHRFDKHQLRSRTRSEERRTDASDSNIPESRDTDRPAEQTNSNNWAEIDEQNNSDNWADNNQQDSSNNWSADNEPNTD